MLRFLLGAVSPRVALRWEFAGLRAKEPVDGKLLRRFAGASPSEVRAQLPSPDLELIAADQAVPPGWAPEILRVDPAGDSIDWALQTNAGRWVRFYGYSHAAYLGEGVVPAYLYARGAEVMRLRGLRVAPVAGTLIENGVCRPFRSCAVVIQNVMTHNREPFRETPETGARG